MQIIISPAKKMVTDETGFAPEALPRFLAQTETLLETLRAMPPQALQKLWKCSEALARLNVERLETMDLHRNLTPALTAYEGIQYQYMAPGVMEGPQLDYLRAHLRILSGFYGLLRPFDGVTPYRLEMQARLWVEGHKDLYAFWGSCLADALAEETDCVLNLASKEYSRAVAPHFTGRFITCTFGELKEDRVVEKGTACKMARGQMVRWLAEHQIRDPEGVRDFDALDYAFSPAHSTDQDLVFIKGGT